MTSENQSPNLYLNVAPDTQRVERGNEAVFLITLENRGREAQAQSLQLDGLPQAWCRLDFDARTRVFPGERRTASLLVTIPADANAAYMAFSIVARAGSDESRASCALEVTAGGQAPEPPQPQTPAAVAPGLSLSRQRVEWRGEAQGSETVMLTVRNVSGENADYLLSLEGLASHWYTLAGQVSVPARQAVEVALVLTPPAQARQDSYPVRIKAVHAADANASAEATATLVVAAPSERQTTPAVVSPVVVEEPQERHTGAPVLPPEVVLGPRSSFRFGPGEVTSQATITVSNPSRLIERYQIVVRGIDEDWYQLTSSEISLQPGASMQVPLRLTPRTGAQFPAGDYSFRVRVAPFSFPDSFAEVAGTISIAGQVSFDARVTPNRRTGRKEKFKLTLLNTGGLPISPWLEASDPQGMCKFWYEAPTSLEVGEEAVIPIWVGSSRQGLAGEPKTLDFRLRVSPAGGGSSSARSFDATLIHQPFLSSRVFFWSMLVAFIAAIVGMISVIGFSKIGDAATVVRCGYDDDFQEVRGSQVLVKEECGGAPIPLQKGLFTAASPVPTSEAETPTVTPTTASGGGATGDVCQADESLGIELGQEVRLRTDAIVRESPAGEDTGRRGDNKLGTVKDGPECAGDLVWWQVETDDGTGWVAEQDQAKVRLILEP